ncbi:hypothetical protein FACS1894116_14410 [Betaproteobacteria bacterium]|nr:hypothetical protein FACS1894116_14410 [Betaproteobacteria bacterium]GHU26665.1 hypothetical protein FACS189488_14810 [Betaproteobacteria bacterium]GHU33265.1 hypothetical protein FACS189497_14990 [Betaproteobacteria bacterium]
MKTILILLLVILIVTPTLIIIAGLYVMKKKADRIRSIPQLIKDFIENIGVNIPNKNGVKYDSYSPKNALTITEMKLYHILRLSLPEYYILAQVQMSSFINVYTRDIRDKKGHLNRIIQKSVDYLIIDKTGKTIAAIELQDKTHDRPDRQYNDQFKREILDYIGIPLVEFHATALPNIDQIKKRFSQVSQTAQKNNQN